MHEATRSRATYIRVEDAHFCFPCIINHLDIFSDSVYPLSLSLLLHFICIQTFACPNRSIMRSTFIPFAAALVGSAAAWPHPTSNSTISSSVPTVTSGTAGTETMTTYTTVTTCPVTVTQTSGSSIAIHTTLTTSTITVTSCKHGCHPPTPVPTDGSHPSPDHGNGTVVVPTHPGTTVLTSTLTSFVPKSTLLTSNGAEYYSTWLATTHLTTYITTEAAPAVTPGAHVPTPEMCPPAETIYKTIYLPAPSAGSSSSGDSGSGSGSEDHATYTLTLPDGSTTTAVVSVPGTPSTSADAHPTTVTNTGTGGHVGPTGTSGGHGDAHPSGTGAYSYTAPHPSGTGAVSYHGYEGRVKRSWFF